MMNTITLGFSKDFLDGAACTTDHRVLPFTTEVYAYMLVNIELALTVDSKNRSDRHIILTVAKAVLLSFAKRFFSKYSKTVRVHISL